MNYDWYEVLSDLKFEPPMDEPEFQILCPFHEDSRKSCSVNYEKGKWICYANCGRGSLKTFVQRFKGWSKGETKEYLLSIGLRVPGTTELFKPKPEEPDIVTLPEVGFPFEKGKVPKWIFDRGFTKKTLHKWGAGIDDQGGLALPIKDRDSRSVGWVIRQKDGTQQTKYLYTPGFKKSRLLFGEHLLQKPIENLYVVEGPLDALWLDQHGYAVVSLLGCFLSKHQLVLLSALKPDRLILALDNDEAGKEGKKLALTRYKNYGIVKTVKLPSEVKDVQDIRESDTLNEVLGKTYSW